MYQIVNKGKLVALCDRPRWVRVKPESGAYIEARREDAVGVAIGGRVYALSEVDVRQIDGAEVLFESRGRLERLSLDVAAIEDALCEQDAASEEAQS